MSTICTKDYVLTVKKPPVDAYWTMEESGLAVPRTDKVSGVRIVAEDPTQQGIDAAPGLFGNGLGIPSKPGTCNTDTFALNPPNGLVPALSIQTGLGFSLAYWFKIIDWTDHYFDNPGILFNNDNFPQVLPHFDFVTRFEANNQQVSWFLLDNNGVSFQPVRFTPLLNTWYFCHAFFDGNSFGFSINNGAENLSAGPVAVVAASGPCWLQFSQVSLAGGLNSMAVVIDEFLMFLRGKLSASQLTYLYNGGAGRTWPLTGFP